MERFDEIKTSIHMFTRALQHNNFKNLYLLLAKADIWEKSLTHFRVSIYRSEIFTSSEN